MNYQRVVCWGDSQTYGARTYGCYPLHLVRLLNRDTRYIWNALPLCQNGHTVRDLWFRLCEDLLRVKDTCQACVLIGANDVGNQTPLPLFQEYYKQALDALAISGFRVVHCGEIPAIFPDGHAYFSSDTEGRRQDYNSVIDEIVTESTIARLVRFPELGDSHFVDPVHFSEDGNIAVATSFAESIRNY